MKPFRQGRFEDLPERPRIAHPYLELAREEVELTTPLLGRVRIHLRRAGKGPPLLLVHGLMTSGYSFRHVIEPLAREHALLVPDLPGAGLSPPVDAPLTATALAQLLIGLVDALGVRGCLCVGNSMGGYLCLRAALDDPGVFAALVDVHSPGVPMLRLRALHLALSTSAGRALLHALVARDPLRWAHRNVHYRDESLKSLEEAEAYGRPLASRAGRDAFISYLRDTLDPSSMAELVGRLRARRNRGEPFPIPLGLLYSTEDPMVPPAVGKRLAALVPSAELHFMEDTSHFTHVDSPDRLVAWVARFFRRAAPDLFEEPRQ